MIKNKKMKQTLVISIVTMFLLTSFISFTTVAENVKTISNDYDHEVYSWDKIQDAIDRSNPGDTIFVHQGVYEEDLVIPEDKLGLTLIGANKNDVTIWIEEGKLWPWKTIDIKADNVTITGFTISYSDPNNYGGVGCCIYLDKNSVRTTIQGNIITNFNQYTSFGIRVGKNCDFTSILDNEITNCVDGVFSSSMEAFKFIDVSGNIFIDNARAISFQKDDDNDRKIENPRICDNTIENCIDFGIFIREMYGIDSSDTFSEISNNIIRYTGDPTNSNRGNYGLYISDLTLRDGEVGLPIKGNLIEHNIEGMILGGSNYTVTDNEFFYNSGCGLNLRGGRNSKVIDNEFENNAVGMILISTRKNDVRENNFKDNSEYGLKLYDVKGCTIYHNNFDNSVNVIVDDYKSNSWDDGSQGNYWSDYTIKYEDAKHNASSGSVEGKSTTWDTPYKIEDNNRDNHPWIKENGDEVDTKSKTRAFTSLSSFIMRFLFQFQGLQQFLQRLK